MNIKMNMAFDESVLDRLVVADDLWFAITSKLGDNPITKLDKMKIRHDEMLIEIERLKISQLRSETGHGMLTCKKALVQNNNDYDEALDVLRNLPLKHDGMLVTIRER